MYSILVTDDEQIVIDSLSLVIRRNFPGQVALYTALSGSEALETVRSREPDIVFMDINMPGFNGLETVSLIKQSNPGVVIIILSAYDDFQYAQEAVNLGVYKYLTKPVNRNLIVKTIRDAMGIIDSKRGKLTNDIELHKKLHFVSSIVESDFIYSCVFCGNKDVNLSSYLDYFGIRDNSPWFFCCMEIPRLVQMNSQNIYHKIRTILNAKSRCIIGSFMMNRLIVFFPAENISTGQQSLEDVQKKIIHDVYTTIAFKVAPDVRMGISDLETDMRNTTAAYNDALSALNRTSPDGGIVYTSKARNAPNEEQEIVLSAGKILNRLQAGDMAGVRGLVSSYCALLFTVYSNDINKIKTNLFELLVKARTITTDADISYRDEAFDDAFEILSKTNDQNKIEQFVQERCTECAAAMARIHTKQEKPIIKEACVYISEHLAENITLEHMASLLHVSQYYLSKLFKEEKGDNFIKYVTNLRMNKAKDLLQDSSLSIKEITAATGYNDQNYFSKLFKLRYGITPTEFRDASREEIGGTKNG